MLKNNKNVFIGVIILVIVLLGGGVYLVSKKAAPKQGLPTAQDQVVATLKPEEIGLTLVMGADGKRVVMQIAKTDGITSIDYQLSYTSAGDIPRGAIGHIDATAGQKITKEIVLGTCSDVCHYDQGVKNIKIVVKVTKSDGNLYQVEQSLQ